MQDQRLIDSPYQNIIRSRDCNGNVQKILKGDKKLGSEEKKTVSDDGVCVSVRGGQDSLACGGL